MRNNLTKRFGCLQRNLHSCINVRNRTTHLDTGATLQTVTLNTLDPDIGCFGSSIKSNKTGNQVIKLKNTYSHALIIIIHKNTFMRNRFPVMWFFDRFYVESLPFLWLYYNFFRQK